MDLKSLTQKGRKVFKKFLISYDLSKAKDVFSKMIKEGKLTGVMRKKRHK
jgi:hypothetical protein